MARRNSKSKKLQPAVLEHYFNLPAGTSYIDINQINSLANRRFYRQGLMNAVASIEVQFTPNPGQTSATGDVIITKLPNTWVMANSYEKGFRHYMAMVREAMDGSESIMPRYHDFKINMDTDHHQAGFGANLKPASGPGTGLITVPKLGEWDPSKIVIPVSSTPGTALQYEIIATGANYPPGGASGLSAVSLIEGYANSRALPYPEDPNVPDDTADVSGSTTPENWIGALTTEGTRQDENVLDNLTEENNAAPYPFENGEIPGFPGTFYGDTLYPGGELQMAGTQFHDKLLITTSTIGGSDTAIGGVFPCGLIRLDTTVNNGSAQLILRLVPGDHRGYLAESMLEM
jgi:hypothetical protein